MPTKQPDLAQLFEQFIADCQVLPPRKEYVFSKVKGWRLDYAWPQYKIAVELQGGIFGHKGGHHSISGLLRDMLKLNHAQFDGWMVFYLNKKDLYPKTSQSAYMVVMAVNSLSVYAPR